MVVKNNKIYILPTVFTVSFYNLACDYNDTMITMIVWISFVILVAMITTLSGKYELPSIK